MMGHREVLVAGSRALLVHGGWTNKRKIPWGISLWRPDGVRVGTYSAKDRARLIRDLSYAMTDGRRAKRYQATIGGPAPKPAVLDGLLQAIASDNPMLRRGALTEIVKIGHPAHALLKRRLRTLKDPEARRAVALVVAEHERFLRYLNSDK